MHMCVCVYVPEENTERLLRLQLLQQLFYARRPDAIYSKHAVELVCHVFESYSMRVEPVPRMYEALAS